MTFGAEQSALYFDVYGATVRFSSTERHHYTALLADYEPFRSPSPIAPVDIDFVVERRALGQPGPHTVVASLGDHLESADGTVRLSGPRVGEDSAYVTELRGYFTAGILRLLVQRQHIQQVHASVIDSPVGSVVFAGPKKSGKTSLALLTVATGRTYKSNDISFLRVAEGSGQVEAFGLPQSFTVGLGAQDWFARNLPHVGLRTRQEGMAATDLYLLEIGEKRHLTRQDIEQFAKVDATPTRLGAVVFPEPNMHRGGARIRKVSADEAAMRLAMLAEIHLRWGLPPTIDAAHYFDQMKEVITRAVEQADCYHLQWCSDHSDNLALLDRTVFDA